MEKAAGRTVSSLFTAKRHITGKKLLIRMSLNEFQW